MSSQVEDHWSAWLSVESPFQMRTIPCMNSVLQELLAQGRKLSGVRGHADGGLEGLVHVTCVGRVLA